jgi:hypothetical protein
LSNLTEYTEADLRVQPNDPPYIEAICRAICEHDRISNPDLEIKVNKKLARVGEGITYKLWQYRLPMVRIILAKITLEINNQENLGIGENVDC